MGICAVAWTARGIVGIDLPEPDVARARARMRRRFPHAPPRELLAELQPAIDSIRALLRGEPTDLTWVPLDMQHVDPFDRGVYEVARTIPFGQTLTYGQIATRLGDVHLAREVGQALARNPLPIVVPCHRVVGAGGKLGGFSARGGVATKQRLLSLERAPVSWQLSLDAAGTP